MSDRPGAANNPHLARAPVLAGAPLPDARRIAVLVHGRDQDERVMLAVVGRLALPDVAYLLPVASQNTWYPGRYFDPLPANAPWLAWSLDAVEATVGRARASGAAGADIVLGGFSQGACVVAEFVARRPRPWAGVAILTGTLMGPDGEETEPARVEGLPMFLGASRYDPWVKLERAQATAAAFERAGAQVTFETYDDREHLINDQAVAGLRRLLTGER
jgi:predicted esterase